MRKHGIAVGRRIGDGAYSKVYVAQMRRRALNSTMANRKVACKVIDGRRSSAEYINRFLPRELKIVRHICHPHIVSVFKMLEIGPYICCLMELCPYGDLLHRIQMNGALSKGESKLFFCQMVSAIQYLHNLGICHRDVKCENVLVYDRYCIKLTDFGFARRFSRPENVGGFKMSETFCGSTSYASPEVLKGIPYDPRLYDAWSLGCVLYIMTTGSMPFKDDNLAAMIRYQEAHEILYPDGVELEDSLKWLIEGLLDPDVRRRTTITALVHESWLQLKPK